MTHILLLCIVYISFISLGLPDAVVGVAWPAMRGEFGQPLAAVGLVTLVMTACGAASSFVSVAVVKRIGTGPVVLASCVLTAGALLGMSQAPSFAWLVAMGVPLGLGAGAVDASLNNFVAQHYSSRHMNWLHGSWGIGATTGPLIIGAALASTGGWRSGALTVGLMQMVLVALLLLSLGLWTKETATPPKDDTANATPATFKPATPWAMWLGPLTFVLYVSAEMGTGLWAASILVEARGLTPAAAGVWVSAYFGAITVGRFGIGLVANRLGNRRLVRFGAVLALCGAALFAVPGLPSALSLLGLVAMGLGCAPIFPSLMHETGKRFAPDVARTVIGRQVGVSYAGVSVVPAAMGLLATWAGLGAIMPAVVLMLLLMLLCSEQLNRLT